MRYTKFRGNRATGSGEEDFLKEFNNICDPDATNKLSFPVPMEVPHKIWL